MRTYRRKMPRGVSDLLLVAGIILLAAGVTAMVDHIVNRGSGWYDGRHSDALTIGLGLALLALGRAVRSSE